MTQIIQNIKKIIEESEKSAFLNLNSYDFLKGFVMAVFTALFTTIFDLFSSGNFTINWVSVGSITAGATGSYLLKNLLSNNEGKLTGKIENNG